MNSQDILCRLPVALQFTPLWKRERYPVPGDCRGEMIEIGKDELRSTFCFQVVACD